MTNPGGWRPAGVRGRRQFGAHLTHACIFAKPVKPTPRAGPSAGATVVLAGVDVAANRAEGMELLDAGWHDSRYAFDDVLKARGLSRSRSKRSRSSSPPRGRTLHVSQDDPSPETERAPGRKLRGSRTGGGRRRHITTMTNAQIRHLGQRIRAIIPAVGPRLLPSGALHHPASLLTLTYPGRRGWHDRFVDPHLCKRHLRALWRRIIRRHPDTWAIWVIELQDRRSSIELPPAWHFHLLLGWPADLVRDSCEDWCARTRWLSEAWSHVMFRPRRAPREHIRRGLSLRKVTTPQQLAEYLFKPGDKISLDRWATHGRPFSISDDGDRIFDERVARVRRAVRRYGIDTRQGALWGTFNEVAYRRSCRVLAAPVAADVAARLREAMDDWWREHFSHRGIEPQHGMPNWLDREAADRALRAAGVTARDLLSGHSPGQVIDVTSGEVADPFAKD